MDEHCPKFARCYPQSGSCNYLSMSQIAEETNMRIRVMSMLDTADLQTGSGGCDSGSRDSKGSHKALANHAV